MTSSVPGRRRVWRLLVISLSSSRPIHPGGGMARYALALPRRTWVPGTPNRPRRTSKPAITICRQTANRVGIMTAIGGAIGLAAAIAIGRVAESLLYAQLPRLEALAVSGHAPLDPAERAAFAHLGLPKKPPRCGSRPQTIPDFCLAMRMSAPVGRVTSIGEAPKSTSWPRGLGQFTRRPASQPLK
jgi:hypothetical protein